MKSNRTIIIWAVVIIILLIGIGVYAASVKPKPPVIPNYNQNVLEPSSSGNILDILKKLFGGNNNKPYVQVPPIDANGCDANGLDKNSFPCYTGY